MNKTETKELKAAINQLDRVVSSMPYHNKLNKAWKRLHAAIQCVLKDKPDAQMKLFRG